MLFRQLFDPASSTYSYLLADPDAREAIIIDPVREQAERDAQIISELGLTLVATLETHVHADHVTGAWLLKQATGAQIVYPVSTAVGGADRLVGEGDTVSFGRFAVETRLTPGHTDGCATYVCSDRKRAFTGDALLIRGSGRTDFQSGDSRQLYRSVWDQILSLPDDTEIFPGHDYKGRTASTVREEKLYNPRMGEGQSEDDFVETMAALSLAYPRQIDRALPANKALGRLDGDVEVVRPTDPWAGSVRSPTGVRHVDISWVASHKDQVRLIDVRQVGEYTGPLGHIAGSELVPLDRLVHEARMWKKEQPIVTICRSSGRSDQAALQLEALGFHQVASMVGGMMAWQQLGLAA